MVELKDDQHIRTLLLRPNRSMTWNGNRQVILGLSLATLLVPTLWALRGMWLALPLAGLELLALIGALYVVCVKLGFRQVIRIEPDCVNVAEGYYFPQRDWQLDRSRTALAVQRGKHPWDAIKVTIYDRDKRIALGEFLNKEDSETLLQHLTDCGLRIRSNGVAQKLPF
jgi:uncharacterized membrane protein